MRTNAKVYVMKAADGRIKLGHSRNPEARAKAVANEYNVDVKVVYASQIVLEAERIERLAHKVLALHGNHICREWFEATVDAAITAIGIAIKQAGNEELPLGGWLLDHKGRRRGANVCTIHMGVDQETFDMIDELRVKFQPLLTPQEVWRLAIQELHAKLYNKNDNIPARMLRKRVDGEAS